MSLPRTADEPDDAIIVAQVLAGDAARFEALMRRHNQRVFRTARAILRSDAEAEDAAQQAWLSAYTHLAQWNGGARFSTWLTRIVAREALHRLRGRGHDHLELVDDRASPAMPSPEDETTRAEVRAMLERAIDALPEAFRTVLVLRDLEELSSAEVGEVLGLTEEAVRVRLHRARRALRAGIEEQLETSARELFPFLGERCDRICAAVLRAIRESMSG
ncbi:RNA polymerase sigma factor [Sandaracinus amylolyticus]|uniref:RNA polymerase sigma factor n=1 Tax=Sandaracinus amylolyticus TaxID=927083 RepID=UPI001F0ACFF1|nr:RNA polymerase sigma factor [Sandaracinus amylolyticus]